MVSLHPRSTTSPLFQSPVAHHHSPSAHTTELSYAHSPQAATRPVLQNVSSPVFSGLQHLGTLSWLEVQWVSQTAIISVEREHQRSNLSVLVPKARLSLATLQNRTTYRAEIPPSCYSFHPNKIQSWEMTQFGQKITWANLWPVKIQPHGSVVSFHKHIFKYFISTGRKKTLKNGKMSVVWVGFFILRVTTSILTKEVSTEICVYVCT